MADIVLRLLFLPQAVTAPHVTGTATTVYFIASSVLFLSTSAFLFSCVLAEKQKIVWNIAAALESILHVHHLGAQYLGCIKTPRQRLLNS